MKIKKLGYIDDKGVGHIPLTRGLWALCDAHWFHILSQHNWYAHLSCNGRWYATTINSKQTTQYMHRIVMGVTDPKIQIDHKNREVTLDNRENNLRMSTKAQNAHNQGMQNTNTSGFKGVSWSNAARLVKHWQAKIVVDGKAIHLGMFETAIEAAAVYNFAAKQLHGEFAVLNDLSQAVI